jgi:hypothetical protein
LGGALALAGGFVGGGVLALVGGFAGGGALALAGGFAGGGALALAGGFAGGAVVAGALGASSGANIHSPSTHANSSRQTKHIVVNALSFIVKLHIMFTHAIIIIKQGHRDKHM